MGIHIDKPQTNYAGTVANGVKSSVMPSDGSKSFLVFEYKPDCPKKNKKMSSFIAQEESMFLDNEKILDNAMGMPQEEKEENKDIEINNLIGNMEKYRFNQKTKLKELENSHFPSLPSVPSLPSLPGGLNSGALTDAANTAKDLAGAGKDALGDISHGAKSMVGGGGGDDTAPGADGKRKDPTNLVPNSLSEPSIPRSFTYDEKKNILPAMSNAQANVDPNSLTDANKASASDDPKAPTIAGAAPGADKPQVAPLEMPGKKKSSGPEPTDLTMAGKKGPDPMETMPDNEDEKKDEEPVNKDIPSNSKKGGETTNSGKAKLRKIYNSGYFQYLEALKKKFEKISEAIKKFIELNMPLFGNKNLDLEYCESVVCFEQGANITNMPDVYDVLLEKGKNMENLIKRLIDRINARIYKTSKIKESWR